MELARQKVGKKAMWRAAARWHPIGEVQAFEEGRTIGPRKNTADDFASLRATRKARTNRRGPAAYFAGVMNTVPFGGVRDKATSQRPVGGFARVVRRPGPSTPDETSAQRRAGTANRLRAGQGGQGGRVIAKCSIVHRPRRPTPTCCSIGTREGISENYSQEIRDAKGVHQARSCRDAALRSIPS